MSGGRKKRDGKVDRITEAMAIKFMHEALVHNRIRFGYEWQGWRMAGRYLVTPEGDRVCANRLLWLVRRESMREKLFKNVQATGPSNVIEFRSRRKTA